ncbi:MAG TPA: phosphoenolpyruvate carboxykinase [Nitriliruptorales bacterium]|nr:phosphoenolpyruvate carboxykinase [Nitriliruptorales bacterium]
MATDLPPARSIAENPSQEQMREWALRYLGERIQETEFSNLNYTAEVTARLKRSTFFVADSEIHQQRMPRAEAEQWARQQDEYIASRDMLLIEGYIGPDPDFRTGSRLYIEREQANIPAMQQQLYFDRDDGWEPEFTVIYTPGLRAPGKPDDRLIIVNLDTYVTRVLGSDYFGESKMGGLRMWNKLIYDRGGLAMHAGAKVFPAEHVAAGQEKLALIIGLSGTGKTTTTFRQQHASLPVQDDFVALMPGGEVRTTENGCFAKTFGLNPEDEPNIYGGTTDPRAWLENVSVDGDGRVDFHDTSYTANGRSTFPLEIIRHRDPRALPTADYLLILNRNENIIPAVAKLERGQAAAYFMLGESKGTSAGGAAEAGRNLRVPGTNPFFFHNDARQGNRLLELLDTMPDLEVYLLNTGRVGGTNGDERSKKVKISHSSAIVAAIVDGSIEWEEDPDFGYAVATSVDGVDDPELLQPRRMYERQGRIGEYKERVETLKHERNEYLNRYEALDPSILAAVK